MPDPHSGFIIAAFAVTFLVIGGMTIAIILDHRRLKRDLSRLAAQLPANAVDDAERT
jgi:heme exporter protein CcmD